MAVFWGIKEQVEATGPFKTIEFGLISVRTQTRHNIQGVTMIQMVVRHVGARRNRAGKAVRSDITCSAVANGLVREIARGRVVSSADDTGIRTKTLDPTPVI